LKVLGSGYYWITEENKFRKYYRNPHLRNKADINFDFAVGVDRETKDIEAKGAIDIKAFHNYYSSSITPQKLDLDVLMTTHEDGFRIINVNFDHIEA